MPDSTKTVEVRAQGINAKGNDWSLLRDSSFYYPIIFSISNPLDREIQVEVICGENFVVNRNVNNCNLRYAIQISVPPRQTTTRMTGFPLGINPVFQKMKRPAGKIRCDGLNFTARILGPQGGQRQRGRFDFDCPNFWFGSDYDWSLADTNSKGQRTLLICRSSVSEQDDIKELKDTFSKNESWAIEILPSSVRPLRALQRLVLYGVDPDDLAKQQRDSIVTAVQRGLTLYLVAGSDGSGLNWNQQFEQLVKTETTEPQKVGFGEVILCSNPKELNNVNANPRNGNESIPRNLAKIGVRYLDKKMRPDDPSDLALFLLGGYVLILIPGIFGILKKRKSLKSLLWVIPLTFVGSVVFVTVVGVAHFGVMKQTTAIGGVVQDSTLGLTESFQVIEGFFNPEGGSWDRTLSADEDLLINFESVGNFRSILFVENEDGTLEETRETYPRSLNFRIRSIPISEPRALMKASVLQPGYLNQILGLGNAQSAWPREPVKSALSQKISEIADSEILDRFDVDPELLFIGMEGSK